MKALAYDTQYLAIIIQYAVRCANNLPALQPGPLVPQVARFTLARYVKFQYCAIAPN
jgi:hypothetical protein